MSENRLTNLSDQGLVLLMSMHERERWQLILAQVRQNGVARVRDFVTATGSSPATIRRDLTKLTELGHINRVHGGVELRQMVEQPHLATRAFGVSQTLNAARKRAVARLAAGFCDNGDSIILNAGSTTWFMAEFLRTKQLQILTNSFPIAQELMANSNNRIILPGGEVYREQGIVLSPFDEDAIQHFVAGKMFMSCYSITSMGIVEGDPLIARAETKLLARAGKLIVIADSSKFKARGSLVVCKLSRVHTLITDDGAPADVIDHIRGQGVEVIIAPMESREAQSVA